MNKRAAVIALLKQELRQDAPVEKLRLPPAFRYPEGEIFKSLHTRIAGNGNLDLPATCGVGTKKFRNLKLPKTIVVASMPVAGGVSISWRQRG